MTAVATTPPRRPGDGQNVPASGLALFEALFAGAELVVGSRFASVSTFRSTWLRRFGNRFLSTLLTILCGSTLTDPTSGFRGFSGRAIEYFARTHPHDYPEPESLFMAYRQQFKVVEVPVQMRPRMTGQSSLKPFKSASDMVKVSFALMLGLWRPV